MGLYTIIKGLENKVLFFYIFIMIITLFIFKNRIIKLNVILAIVIGIVIIIFLKDKRETEQQGEEEKLQIKLNNIKPEPKNFKDKKNIIEFLFSIQDMYKYNPSVYEEIIDNIDVFFQVYDYIFKDVKYCEYYYQIAKSKARNSTNALHSLIYTIPNSKVVTDKLNRAHERLETLMNHYLNEIYNKCNEERIKGGLDIFKTQILLGPKPFNEYNHTDYTYEFY
jgi:Ca2+/Na+ antiporter